MPMLHSETMALLRATQPHRLRRWMYLTLFWLVVGTLSALHWQLFYFERNPYEWWQLFRIKVVLWFAWGLLTPVILWFGWKWQMRRETILRRLAILFPISVTITMAYLLFYALLIWINSSTVHAIQGTTFAEMFKFTMGVHSTWYFLAFWATIGVENAVIYYRRYHERELLASQLETQLAAAHLAALRNQLQPHFLFNTLHSILALVRQHEDASAIRMLTALSDLLRNVLDHVQRQTVPLREEVGLLRRYIDIEQVRFSDRLTVNWNIADDTLGASVPSFVMQPLAENAIRHGIEKHPGPGRIDVTAQRVNGQLCLDVTDNGVGIPSADEKALTNGHGLGDMRARLDILYPGAYSLEIDSNGASGTTVHLRLPWRDHPHEPRATGVALA